MRLEHDLGRKYYEGGASPSNLGGYVSKSMLFDFAKSPWGWKNSKAKESTPAMALGSLVHCLALTPKKWQEDYAISEFDSYRTKAAQEWRDDMIAKGITPITNEQYEQASIIADSVMGDDDLQPYLVAGYDTEVAMYSESDAINVRGMVDIAPKSGDCLIDLKTISSITSEANLVNVVLNRGYHWQAAMYLDLWNAITGENRYRFILAFVESSAPYETAIVDISEFIELGRDGYTKAISLWKKCVSEDTWTKTISGNTKLKLPHWAIKQ